MEVKTLGVAGAGPMGAGIAQVGLAAGMNVVLFDLAPEARRKAAQDIAARLSRQAEKGQLEPAVAQTAMDRLTVAESLEAFAPCELVVEAIVERLEPKRQLFAELEGIVAPDAVLATNTSSLSVAAIGAGCTNKERVCGLHFFNPVPLMKLVEVIVAPDTSERTGALATAFSEDIGKVPVTVRDGPGFLVNLQGRAYATEGLAIVQEGVTDPATVDRILRDGAGFRMGPFELMDLTGIDVNFAATSYIYQGYQHDARLRTTPLHELMAHAGRHGRKTGRGFYDYGADAAAPDAAAPVAVAPTPQAEADVALRATTVEGGGELEALAHSTGLQAGDDAILIAPVGEDASTACQRLGLDPARTVAIDLTAAAARHLTVMAAPGGSAVADRVAHWLRGHGYTVERIKDSPGFVLQRVLAMVANLGCELAQIGVGSPQDIDLAMKLAQNYPKGPLEWAETLGVERTHAIMQQLHAISGSDRYRPSLWLRRRALLGLSAYQAD